MTQKFICKVDEKTTLICTAIDKENAFKHFLKALKNLKLDVKLKLENVSIIEKIKETRAISDNTRAKNTSKNKTTTRKIDVSVELANDVVKDLFPEEISKIEEIQENKEISENQEITEEII